MRGRLSLVPDLLLITATHVNRRDLVIGSLRVSPTIPCDDSVHPSPKIREKVKSMVGFEPS